MCSSDLIITDGGGFAFIRRIAKRNLIRISDKIKQAWGVGQASRLAGFSLTLTRRVLTAMIVGTGMNNICGSNSFRVFTVERLNCQWYCF